MEAEEKNRVRQISIFIENRPGQLAAVTTLLGEAGINIRALSLADTTDFGILRLIVNDVDGALNVLKREGFPVDATEVVAVEVEDRPGGLASILNILQKDGINVEYMYVFVQKKKDSAVVIFRFDDNGRAVRALLREGVSILKEEEIQRVQ